MLTTEFIEKVEKLGYRTLASGQRFLEIHRDAYTDTTTISLIEIGRFNLTIDDYELGKLMLEYSFTPLLDRGYFDYKTNFKGDKK